MSNFNKKINEIFNRLNHSVQTIFPNVLAETATEYSKERFTEKGFDGKKWPKYKGKEPKRGSLMLRSTNLMRSVRPTTVRPQKVSISAGSSHVRYARIHNEGGVINRAARSETFVRNTRETKGRTVFAKGTKPGKGFTFRSYAQVMPQRQFLGKSDELITAVKNRFKPYFDSNK